MTDPKDLFSNVFDPSFDFVRAQFPERYGEFIEAYDRDALINLVPQDFNPSDPESMVTLLRGAFVRALERFEGDDVNQFLRGYSRPSCSKYPSTWPFCKPD